MRVQIQSRTELRPQRIQTPSARSISPQSAPVAICTKTRSLTPQLHVRSCSPSLPLLRRFGASKGGMGVGAQMLPKPQGDRVELADPGHASVCCPPPVSQAPTRALSQSAAEIKRSLSPIQMPLRAPRSPLRLAPCGQRVQTARSLSPRSPCARLASGSPRCQGPRQSHESRQQPVEHIQLTHEVRLCEAGSVSNVCTGATVCIDGYRCKVTGKYDGFFGGRGWKATGDDGRQLLLTDIYCRSSAELDRTVSELRRAQEVFRSPDDSDGAVAVVHVAFEVCRDAMDSAGRVWLAIPLPSCHSLENYLWQHDCRRSLRDKPEAAATAGFLQACRCAHRLLSQITVLLSSTSKRGAHGNITGRQICVSDSVEPTFQLSCFEVCPSTVLHATGIAGDGRYWPSWVWRDFEADVSEVQWEPHRRDFVDMHALAIAALHCLTALSPAMSMGARAGSSVLQHLHSLQDAWTKYWSDVTRYWRFVKAGVQGVVDLKTVRASYTWAGVHKVVVATDLEHLSKELSDLRHACQGAQDHIPEMEQAITLCNSLLEALRADTIFHRQCSCVRCGGAASEQDFKPDVPSWASIRQCLLGRRTAHCCPDPEGTSTESTGSLGDVSSMPSSPVEVLSLAPEILSSPVEVSSLAPEILDSELSTELAPARSLRSWSFRSYILEHDGVNSQPNETCTEAVVQILHV